jgi:glutamate--cysteine ligase
MKNFFLKSSNKRIDYSKIKQMFEALLEFGWNPILEKKISLD